ncbi:hypothetical protein FIC87_12665 [Eggerthella lenta]|uniref:Head-tail adaptor protein n=1 Tax=Eggerthella lenta TaxID=84112 RepID=A0A5C5BTC6_EGGLN|nr:hypothetical protein [Eggerthella lenta]TNU89046.1 hypothetical protein FIC87_12665 [Eggerthella lenta]
MIRGVPVTLYRRAEIGRDEMGEPIVEWIPETVEDALWTQGEGDSEGLSDGARPLGTDDTVTVHLPKAYKASVAGCEFEILGRRYRVEGDPVGYMPELTPGRYNRRVTARRVDG